MPVSWTRLVPPTFDEFEKTLVDNCQLIDCPLQHRYPQGMYVREIFMPKGSVVTSRIHKFENPFFITQGDVTVVCESDPEPKRYKAPHVGITSPGTRRVLYMHEDTVWITVHLNPDNIQDPDELVRIHTIPHENPLLVDTVKELVGGENVLAELQEDDL